MQCIRSYAFVVPLLLVAVTIVGCDGTSTNEASEGGRNCAIDTDHLRGGTERGAIQAISDPAVVGPNDERVSDLRDDDRVIALLVDGRPLAVPRKLLNQHEIVNLDWANRSLAVTYCPLTGSSLAFDREKIDGAEFDVSGLLFHDNLVMVDARDGESLWPQMSRRATCGPSTGTGLEMVPVLDLRWEHWRSMHPDTRVLPVRVQSTDQSDSAASPVVPARGGSGSRSAAVTEKQSAPAGPVLGLPGFSDAGGGELQKSSTDGIAFSFRDLSTDAGARVVEVSSNQVLFWSESARTAMVYRSSDDFSVENGNIVDDRTGSVWAIDGRAIEGRREGDRLEPVATAYVAMGSAWFDFHPNSAVWGK
jgi:hypothetical protein